MNQISRCSGITLRAEGLYESFRDFFIFVIENSVFLTRMFQRDSRCKRITLRARKALRVMCNTNSRAERLPGAQLPAGPPKLDLTHGAGVFSKMLVT